MKSASAFLLVAMPYFTTIDEQTVSYIEGIVALRTGHAIYVAGLLVGRFSSSYPMHYFPPPA